MFVSLYVSFGMKINKFVRLEEQSTEAETAISAKSALGLLPYKSSRIQHFHAVW
jgi:hypothetical protein